MAGGSVNWYKLSRGGSDKIYHNYKRRLLTGRPGCVRGAAVGPLWLPTEKHKGEKTESSPTEITAVDTGVFCCSTFLCVSVIPRALLCQDPGAAFAAVTDR